MNLNSIKNNLNDIISTMATLTNMEYAIFDTEAELVSSTGVYLKRKGQSVHTASIEEVLSLGNVVVNKPGLMKSCIGCRFANNCPSTIEILSCVKLDGQPIGVVSMTSFTQEGHALIEENLHKYMEILGYMSNLISMYAHNEVARSTPGILSKAIEHLIRESGMNYMVIDRNGYLLHWDDGTQELLSYCDLYTQSLGMIFPQEFSGWIFGSSYPSSKSLVFEGFSGEVFSTPLSTENGIEGYVLRFDKRDGEALKRSPSASYLDRIITRDPKLMEVKRIIEKISSSPSSVLITGESGTGKEIAAKAIHFTSNRSNKPFIPVNCANIPESLFESELFGYEEGAFTGARKRGKPGILELANNGTVFLDEIGELPHHSQAKLLRFLQDGVIQRLGSITNIPLNVRIIAATNQDLELLMSEGKFREDLFYRLNVVPIHLPPLRERKSDIPILIDHFIKAMNSKLSKRLLGIDDLALEAMMDYSWPGNVRELENSIEYAMNMEDTSRINLTSLPARIFSNCELESDLRSKLSKSESSIIISALDKNGWDMDGKIKTAEELGISLRTLYRRLK
ncbi:sigma 54-interacting transcriptional regulator [Gudongella oleilytica]|uniref:sigma-54 interaction domain-containing protein n=1 Tax=Gudongella oleilytica TaxID=1582259 RepID=UPI002A36A0CB|nr:sigma 54-interacting transcriptional regulator [Gudongella oleilytica]MDY0257674.1 sigma 54-interacting transcriptional regulator [Gudongella oleilytica]